MILGLLEIVVIKLKRTECFMIQYLMNKYVIFYLTKIISKGY